MSDTLSLTHPLVLRGPSAAAARQTHDVQSAVDGGGPVLIVSEAGLEPLSIARLLHGARPDAAFLAIDCASARGEELNEHLFGNLDTSPAARRDLDRVGRGCAIFRAAGGTLVLDNAADLPAGVQRRLARVLRDGEIYVGDGRQRVAVTCRPVALVPPDIEDEVAAGTFRDDLYRRLSATRITLVPLRERAEDIPAIVEGVAQQIAEQRGAPPRTFSPAAMTALAALPWRRNIDEIRALLEGLHAAAPGLPAQQEDVLRQLAFGLAPGPRGARFENLRDARKRFEREYIGAVLARHDWRIADAAGTLGIERANLYRKIRQLGLSRPPRFAS